jgi:hypothetical protein
MFISILNIAIELLVLGSVCLGCRCLKAAVAGGLLKSSCGKQLLKAEI